MVALARGWGRRPRLSVALMRPQSRGDAMGQKLADIGADIATLQADAPRYREMAEERPAAGHNMIGQRQLEFVAGREANA